MRASLRAAHPDLHLEGVGRPHAAAPAVGYMSVHAEQQDKLVNDALGTN